MKKKVVIIGSGISSLSAACYLAKEGMEVVVIEKNEQLGGRARTLELEAPNMDTNMNLLSFFSEETGQTRNKFTFDMGPSWYWMPEIFENFFKDFGKKVSDYYQLVRLDPAYRVFSQNQTPIDLPADINEITALFERLEGDREGGKKLLQFLKVSEYTYNKAVTDYMWRPGNNIFELLSPDLAYSTAKGGILKSYAGEVEKIFKSQAARNLVEFPVLFLGATPQKTPYLYNLMAYTQFMHGTWYPMGGMHKIIEAFVSLGKELGVKYYTRCSVKSLETNKGKIEKVVIQDLSKGQNKRIFDNEETEYTGLTGKISLTDYYDIKADYVVAGADYHHVEQELLDKNDRRYNENYWDKRTMCPSSLLFYVGLKNTVPHLKHHNLFFDADFNEHAKNIYDNPKYPQDPLFYLCAPSKTDPSVAPKGCENIFILIPLACDLEDTPQIREKYFNMVTSRIAKHTGTDINEDIMVNVSYSINNFKQDYNAFKGNAYGLANTLGQTAILKPKLRSKLKNMVYCGQLTVPGPGLPPGIYSGKMAAQEILKK
jgi:phytoene desaturase